MADEFYKGCWMDERKRNWVFIVESLCIQIQEIQERTYAIHDQPKSVNTWMKTHHVWCGSINVVNSTEK